MRRGPEAARGTLVRGTLRDAQIGQIFQQIRIASGLTPVMIAARLGISPTTLAAIEHGEIDALPDGPETDLIVTSYGRMVGVDLSAALLRIHALKADASGIAPRPPHAHNPGRHQHGVPLPSWSVQHTLPQPPGWSGRLPHGVAPAPQRPGVPGTFAAGRADPYGPASHPPASGQDGYGRLAASQPMAALTTVTQLSAENPLQPAERAGPSDPQPSRSRRATPNRAADVLDEDTGTGGWRPMRFALRYVTAPMIAIAGLWYTVQNPTSVHAALTRLPEPIPRIAQAGMDIVLISVGSAKDGLHLISAGDPRTRKADKLAVRRAGEK